jgi:hypothetical protein
MQSYFVSIVVGILSLAPVAGPSDATPTAMMPTDMASNVTSNATTDTDSPTFAPTTTTGFTNDTRFLQAVTTAPIPDCAELDELFCDFLGGEDLSECCLFECIGQLQALFTCVIMETTGEDRSDCEVPVCPTPTPVEASTDKPTSPVSGAGISTGSRVAALAASLLAFAVL